MVARNETPTHAWMTASAVAAAVGGRVVRSGPPAVRVRTDSRALEPGDLFVALRGERCDGHDFVRTALARGASGVIVDRPLHDLDPPDGAFVVRVADTGRALLDLAREHRLRAATTRVVGITGSCGKTSTKDMCGVALSAAMPTSCSPLSYNNHVGVPLSLLAIQPRTRAAVIEIGTNAPGEIAMLTDVARPDVGVVTCVAEAHLAGLGSLEGVAAEKASLFRGVRPGGVAVLNVDDPMCRRMAEQVSQRVVRVALTDRTADWWVDGLQFRGYGAVCRLLGEVPLQLPRFAEHDVRNALLAIAVAAELGVELHVAIAALARMSPTPRRLEPRIVAGIRILDDTYNMNPASARAAIATLARIATPGRRVAVLGAMLELGPRSAELHRALGAQVAAARLDRLVVVGDAALPIADGALAAGMPADRVRLSADRDAAKAALVAELAPEDVVLVKASRGVALDVLVDALCRDLGTACAAEGVV